MNNKTMTAAVCVLTFSLPSFAGDRHRSLAATVLPRSPWQQKHQWPWQSAAIARRLVRLAASCMPDLAR
jgi:hypothetical protein